MGFKLRDLLFKYNISNLLIQNDQRNAVSIQYYLLDFKGSI
jgi:hypothetical protein